MSDIINDIIESIKDSVTNDDLRTEVYYGVMDVLIKHEVDLDDLMGMDDILDVLIEDHMVDDDEDEEDEIDEDETEDWDNQDRDRF